MKIGSLKPKNRLFLAPMADVNDTAFRMLCKEEGCGLAYTGMVNPLTRQALDFSDKPAIQIFCTSAKGVAGFVRKHGKEASLFDLNLGCPSAKAGKCGFGAFMRDLGEVEGILEAMKNATSKPVTMKLRKSASAMGMLRLAEKYCDAVAIHPRIWEQGYSGEPDMGFALKLKENTSLPVIYSGNANAGNAAMLLEKFDFLMFGRAAMGNPGVFAELRGKKAKTSFTDYMGLAEKHGIPWKQVKAQSIRFATGMEGAKSLRTELSKATSAEELRGIWERRAASC